MALTPAEENELVTRIEFLFAKNKHFRINCAGQQSSILEGEGIVSGCVRCGVFRIVAINKWRCVEHLILNTWNYLPCPSMVNRIVQREDVSPDLYYGHTIESIQIVK